MNARSIPRPAPVIRIALAVVVFAVQGVGLYAQENSLWESRRDISRRSRAQDSAQTPVGARAPLLAAIPGAAPLAFDRPPPPAASPRDWLSALVAEHGWVREAHMSPRSGAPLIVHIQDAHGIEDAQRHIAALVGRLADADPAGPVALEGASGPVDVEALRRFPDSAITGTIADFLLQRGLIAGPEHAALTAPRSPLLIGAEDDGLYHQNVGAFRAARANAAPLRDRLRRFQDRLDRAERAHASPALRDFHRRTRDHDEGRLSLTAYLEYLNGAVPARALPKAPNIEALNKIARLEKTLDFKAVEVERRRLVDALVDRLPRPALADLVSSGLDVRAGRTSVGRYHARLRSVARAHGIDLRAFAPLAAYIEYVSAADAIDRAALLEEIALRRNRVQNALARTPRERALVEIVRDLALLEKAFAHTLAPTDWREYTARRDGLLALNTRYQGLDPAADTTDFTSAELKPFEDFCELALSRNAALSQNLLNAIAARGADRGVLVAGGFHTEGLTALWRRQQVSYVVVAPAMRDIPADNPYLELLAQDPLPVEKLVAGERVYLSRPIALAGPGVVQRFYLALQQLMQNGRTTVAEPGVTVSRAPLRGGVSFRIGTFDLHARFNDAAETWAARWRNNFDPGPNAVGGMMFWLPRLWNASTPKALHVTAARYRGLSVPAEAGLAGLIAAGIGAAVGLPGDFDLFVRLSLAAYAVLHLGDFLTRDRRRAVVNAGLAAGLVAAAGFLLGLPAEGVAVVGLTPAQAAYLVFLGLHATMNLLVIRFPRVRRPPAAPAARPSAFTPTVLTPAPAGAFRDRRAPANAGPVAAQPPDRRNALPANPGLQNPSFPAGPAQDHLTAALFDLAREPLSPDALKPGVLRLRNAFKTTANPTLYETRAVEAWGHVTQTVRLLRNSARRVSRLPISDLPVPVVAGPTFVLDIDPTNGTLFLLAPNGARRDAPMGGGGQRPLVMGRGVMERRLGLAPALLGGVSRLHFEVVRDGDDVLIRDFSTNGTLTPARRDFDETREATVFDPLPTRRGSLWSVAIGALLLTALFLAPVDVAGAATPIPLDGGGLKALVEPGDSLWRILLRAATFGLTNPNLMAVTGLVLVGVIAARWTRRKPRPASDTTFLDSQINWESVADFGDSPAAPRTAPPPTPPMRSALPWALIGVVAARWAQRALPRAVNEIWRAPTRGALGLTGSLARGIHWFLDAPHRLKTRHEKHRAGYEDPSTFFAHTRTGFGDPAGPAPAAGPTRMRRFAATLYGWLNRRPRFNGLSDADVSGAAESPRPAPSNRTDFARETPGTVPDAFAAPLGSLSAIDRALNDQSGRLAEEWQDEGLFDVPPSLVPYGDGENLLMEIPFPRAAVRAIQFRLAARRWLGVPLGKDLGYALTFLNNEGWLRVPGEARGANTPDRFPHRLAALLKDKITGGVMHDPSAEKLLVNIPAGAAWPFFFKMWWRGTREGYPRGVGLSRREEQAFFGGETLRFPSGEPLVTQVEVAWGIDGSLGPENIHLGNLDAVADYVLLHFEPQELAALADRPNENPEAARADLIAALRQDVRQRVAAAFASASSRAIALGAPAGAGLEMNLALSWKMTEGGSGGLARLVPQIVSVRTSLTEAAARAARRVLPPAATIPPAAPAGTVLNGVRQWARAARNAVENVPGFGGPLARAVAPLILAAALFVLPLWVVAQGTPPPAWSLNEALVTQKIAPALTKELAKSLPAGTDLAALLRNANDATSAAVLASTVEHLGKFEKGRFRQVLEKTRPHIVVAPKGPAAAAAVEFKTGRPVIYIGGADAQPAYLFVALVHELSHLERSAQLRSKKITRAQDEGLALEDTARAMEYYAGLSVVRIAYDQYQINEQRWIAHRFLDGTVTVAPHALSPKEAQRLTAPLRAAMRLAEQRRYPGAVYVNSKNLGGGRYEVRFRVPPRGAEIVVDVTPQRVSAVPGGTEVGLAMIGGVFFRPRAAAETGDDGTNAARAALLRALLLGEAGPVRFDVPARAFKDGENYWGASDLEDLRRRVAAATDGRAAEGFGPALQLLAADTATARDLVEGRGTAGDIEAFALREAGTAAAREASARGETTLHANLLGFDSWEAEEKEKTRHYLAGLVAALKPGATVVVPVDQPGPLADLWSEAARRGLRVRPVTPADVPGLVNGAGQLVLSVLVDWIERVNAAGTEPPIGRGSRVIARNDGAVVPLDGFVIIAVARLSAAIAREVENLRTILTQA